MNLKEVADAVMSQGQTTDALKEAVTALTSLVTELSTKVTTLESRLEASFNALSDGYASSHATLSMFMHGDPALEVAEDETDEQRATRVGVLERLSEVEALVRGRNRSAPVKRNMTDPDARRVLTGDVKDLGHKEAGEIVGLTYAQVYSCRLEYTFKHIHKELKDSGFKNEWTKPKGHRA